MIRLVARLLLRLLCRYEVAGGVPASPPSKLLIIANHQTFFDPLFIIAHCPFDITWITHTQIAAKWHFRLVLRLVPHLVVDTANPMSMKAVMEAVNSGKPVCIFPEGRLTVTGSLMKVYDGLAFLQHKTGAQLLPVNIDGGVASRMNRLEPPFPRKWRPRMRVTFFPLATMPEPPGNSARQRRRAASVALRRMLERNWFEAAPRTTLFEAFLNAAELYGRDRELVEDIRFLPDTFGTVLRGALALGRLTSRHTSENEIVGVMMPNATPTLMLLFGLFSRRRVPAMINYTAGVDGMQSAIEAARIKTILTSRAFLDKAKLHDKVSQLKNVRILHLEDLRAEFGIGDKLWLLLFALRFPRQATLPGKASDPAIVLFTSGSEGKPKGVVLSHGAIVANITQARAVFEFNNRDKFLCALPLFHCFGLVAGAFVPLVTGARVFLYPSPLHYRMIPEMAYDRDCTVLFGTGTFLTKYAQMANEYDFYSIRYVVCGAEKLPEPTRRMWMEKFGIRILEGYGVTEMAPIISINTPVFNRVGSVGKVLPGIDYRVEPVAGIEQGGMLHVKGPNQMLGYLLHSEPGVVQQPKAQFPGWYETGDIVELDADGYVRIVGRVKRFAKVAGEMVSLEVVENIANLAAPGKAHASTTVASDRRGEVIVLVTEDRTLRRERLIAAARQAGLPELAVARVVLPVDKIPRLGSGKFDYVTLKELAAARLAGETVEPALS